MDPAVPNPLLRSFERHLRAENRSAQTVATYLIALRQAETFLAATRGTTLAAAGRADLEAYLGDLLTRRAAATAATYYKVLKLLYQWLEDEDELPASPMAKMRPPIIPDQPVPVIPDDGLRRLLAACAGKGFEARRDTAMIMLLLDTGARRAELVDLKLAHVDLDLDVLLVLGKGRRERALPFGQAGVQERLDWRIHDLAQDPGAVAPADLVVLHRVVCCYPDYERLLGAAADRARRALVFSYPPRNPLSRAFYGVFNLVMRPTGSGFRGFAGPPGAMLAVLEDHGLRPTFQRRSRIWQVAGLERAA